ncbi:hypothetical protein JW930_03330 [Candidatus Woesearchaeota archaeon]|nr:hypothetical protein [Candidatus Woesearchaeota archaeon]
MKTTNKIITLLLFCILFSQVVFADGMIHIYDKDMWSLYPEEQQLVAINYENGYENMLISININEDIYGEKAVWVFPVPAEPEKVVIDIYKGFPRLYGKDVDSEFKDTIRTVGWSLAGYSTFPIGLYFVLFGRVAYWRGSSAIAQELKLDDGITIHETVEKMGITSELITTKNRAALDSYLLSKGLEFPSDSMYIIEEYVGEEYSFVISYISNLAEFKQQTQINYGTRYGSVTEFPLGVFVKFPCEKIYFPLKPTSVYGSQRIPILMYVVGHVTPILYKEIKQDADVVYYMQQSYYPDNNLKDFFNNKDRIENFKYTKIKLNPPSKYLVEDLWIKRSAPLTISTKNFLIKTAWYWGILLYVLLSVAASLLSGFLSFMDQPLSRKKLVLFGLWNCLTFAGFGIASLFLKSKKLDPSIKEELKQKGIDVTVRDPRKILYVFLFYVFFLVFLLFTFLLLYFVI